MADLAGTILLEAIAKTDQALGKIAELSVAVEKLSSEKLIDPTFGPEAEATLEGLRASLAETGDSLQGLKDKIRETADEPMFSSANLAALGEAAALVLALREAINQGQKISHDWIPVLNDVATALNKAFGDDRAAAVVEGFAKGLIHPIDRLREMAETLGRAQAGVTDLDEALLGETEAQKKSTEALDAKLLAAEKEAALARKTADEIQGEITKREESREGLLKFIATQQEMGTLTGVVLEETKKHVHDLLDSYDRIGEAVPADLRKVADSLGVLSTAQEQADKKAEQLAERDKKRSEEAAKRADERAQREAAAIERIIVAERKHQEAIEADVRGEVKDLDARTAALINYAQEVAVSGVATVEQADRIRKSLQDLTADYAKQGKDVPADLAAVDKAWDVVSANVEKNAKKQKEALKDLSDALATFVNTIAKGGKDGDTDKQKQQLADLLAEKKKLQEQPSQSIEDLNRLAELDDQIGKLTDSISSFGDKWKKNSGDAKVSTEELNKAINSLFDSVSDKIQNLTADQRNQLQDALNRVTQLGTEGSASADSINNALRDVTDTLKAAGVDTSKLETAFADAKGEVVDFNKAFDEVDKKQSAKKTVGDVAAIAENMKKSTDATEAWKGEIKNANTELQETAKLVAQIKADMAGAAGL